MSILQTAEEVGWEFLKTNIFYQDGSYRDVYIENMNKEKWYKLLEYFMTKNLVGYSRIHNEKSNTNYYKMPENWREVLQETKSAWLFNVKFLEGCICFHHFTDEQVEATIDPVDIQNMENFFKLVEFLDDITRLLNLNEWYIAPENCQDEILINRIINQNKTNIRV